jgi:hypothetical protein
VFLYAFDLIELDGDDLRREPLAVRKATVASLLARVALGLRSNEHLDEKDGLLATEYAASVLVPKVTERREWRARVPPRRGSATRA